MSSSSRIVLAARGCVLALFLLVLAAPAGCTSKAKGVVTGKVTFNKRPVTMGNVAFVGENNRTGSGVISRDGTYTVSDAPVGDVKIVVTVPHRPPMMMGRGPNMPKAPKDMKMPADMMQPDGSDLKDPGSQIPVPDKYTKAETTPLSFTVIKGEQTHDIVLSP
jgi:hypothetical protein